MNEIHFILILTVRCTVVNYFVTRNALNFINLIENRKNVQYLYYIQFIETCYKKITKRVMA